MITDLDDAAVQRLRAQELTYPEVGQALTHDPPGYRHIRRTRRVQSAASFDKLVDALLGWQVQSRSGLHVATSRRRLDVDTVVLMRIGPLHIPCRVVSVVDEPDRRGFAYGTLPGHPETGEEAFVLHRADGGVDFTVTAFSRPATRLFRLGGPLTTAGQTLMTSRYLRSLDD